MSTRTLATLLFFAVLGGSTAAQADPIRAVRLEYTLDPNAKRCPSDQVFRDTVNGRMRFDPFLENAPVRLVVTIEYQQGRYHGRAELIGAAEPWSRDVTPPPRDCRDLIHALGIKVAHKLDPREPVPQNPEPKPSPAKPPPPPQTPENTIPAARRFQLRAGLSGNVVLWSAPSDVAFEGAVDVGLQWSMFSLSGEFRGSPPAGSVFRLSPRAATAWQPSAYDAVGLSTARLAGAIVPCFHFQLAKSRLKPTAVACALGHVGAVFIVDTGLEGERTLPYGAVGGRLAFELSLLKRLSGRIGSDFLGVLNRPLLRVEGQTLWEAPAFSMSFGGGLIVSFP
jgi:hypothetical protein